MSLTLRPYQREAINGLYDWFHSHNGNPLVVIPTAGGKSLVIGTFIKEALDAWPDTRVLVLTHVKELIAQNYAELIGFWPDAPAGIYSAGLGKRDLRSRILFAGIQSIHTKAAQLQRIDLVLVDEAHLIPRDAETIYGRFLAALQQINPHLKIVGFTATPFRLDSGMLHQGRGALFSGIAYEAGVADLIEQGYLCPPVTQRALAQIDTSQVKIVAGEFNAKQLEAVAIDPDAVAGIGSEIVLAGADRRGWLVFGCGVDHCTALRDAIRSHGISCEAIYGDTPGFERDRLIRDFKAQRIRALCSVGVLTTGFNARHVDLIAIARPTKSTGLYIQIVGRGTRLHPGKDNCLILDFGGNIERHGPIDRPRVKAPGEGDGEAPVKACKDREVDGVSIVGCGHHNPTAVRECLECGAPFPPFTTAVDTVASNAAILSAHIRPEWVQVDTVSYRLHQKEGKPSSLCVTYMCGLVRHREWVCFEHTGIPRERAVRWWQRRAPGTAVPSTVVEALAVRDALLKPVAIQVRQSGKFTEVLAYLFEPAPAWRGRREMHHLRISGETLAVVEPGAEPARALDGADVLAGVPRNLEGQTDHD